MSELPPEAVEVTRRESLGALVREVWIKWAEEQPDAKPSWFVIWRYLDEGQREVDMRIGEAVAAAERERIHQLALQHNAKCRHENVKLPFAELIGPGQ